MSDKRKTLNFNSSVQSENTAYIFLEKIRYFQTKFITKLILDFMKEHNIDINSPYEELKNACRQYILDEDVDTPYCDQGKRLKEIDDSLLEIKELLKSSSIQRVQTEPSPEDMTPQKEAISNVQQAVEEEEVFSSMLSSFKMMADA